MARERHLVAETGTTGRAVVAGLGRVGQVVAHLLVQAGFEVVGLSRRPHDLDLPLRVCDASDPGALRSALRAGEVVVGCLPFPLGQSLAEAAIEVGAHYVDLSEDLATIKGVAALGRDAEVVVAPGCGLAPGLVGILAGHLARSYDAVRSIEMRAGALPQTPTGLLGYAFTWSPEGVVNEYLHDAEALRSGRLVLVPPLQEWEEVVLDGVRLEAFTTSGGAGTTCETFAGRVDRLDYKTLRYPGHARIMRFLIDELRLGDDPALLTRLLTGAKPPVDDDVVHVLVAVEGTVDGRPRRREIVRHYRPLELGGRRWHAISWTTAASAVATIEVLAGEGWSRRGVVRQEELDLERIAATVAGSLLQLDAPPS